MCADKAKPEPPAAQAGQAHGPVTDKPRRGWLIAAIVALAVAAAAATFTEIHNYDIFWHLASGDWMLAHGRVLTADPFSIDPLPQWVNVHWLFQVIVSALYAAGGFAALVGLKTLLGAATVIILAVTCRRDAPPAWIVLAGLLALAALETRLAVRPESFTLLFMKTPRPPAEPPASPSGQRKIKFPISKWYRSGITRKHAIPAALAGAAMTAAVVWDPPGRAKPGRILWDEYHSQQPGQGKVFDPTATDRPLDTEWYGPAAVNNWACIYDYVSRFHECGRIKQPLTDDALRDAAVLVIKVPSKAPAPEELSAVERFIERGGGLLMVGEHSNAYGSAYALGALAWRLGCEIRHDVAMPIDAPTATPGPRPLAPHPIMQYAGGVDLAGPSGNGGVEGSEGATISFRTGRAVVLSTGLKSIPTLYSSFGPRPGNPNRPDIRCGAFAQIWAGRRGAGRVVAIADASIFSNVSAFEPKRRELMLGMLDWLNRENRMPEARWLLVLVATGLALLALAMTKPMDKAWPLAVGASAIGWAGVILAVPAWNRAEIPPPKPTLPMVQVAIDSRLSDIRLPHAGLPAGGRDGFGQFELSILRLGYFPRRAAGGAGVLGDTLAGEPNAIVVIKPAGEVTDKYRRMIETYVESGGTLLVLDSPDNRKSAANRLLEPFGLKFDTRATLRGTTAPLGGLKPAGDLKPAGALPALTVSAAWAVEGGTGLVTLDGRAVATVAKKGRGAVVAVGFASRLSDAEMGPSPAIVPDVQQRKVFDFVFALLHQIVEARMPAPLGSNPSTPAPATAPAPAPPAATEATSKP